jgi:hypothetical protein
MADYCATPGCSNLIGYRAGDKCEDCGAEALATEVHLLVLVDGGELIGSIRKGLVSFDASNTKLGEFKTVGGAVGAVIYAHVAASTAILEEDEANWVAREAPASEAEPDQSKELRLVSILGAALAEYHGENPGDLASLMQAAAIMDEAGPSGFKGLQVLKATRWTRSKANDVA